MQRNPVTGTFQIATSNHQCQNLSYAFFRNKNFFMVILVKILLLLGIYNERELGGGGSRTVYLLNDVSTMNKYRFIHLLTKVEITTLLFS